LKLNYLILQVVEEVMPSTVVEVVPFSQASVAFFLVSLIVVLAVALIPAVVEVHSQV
jgi:hypothetical protein